MKKVFNKLSSKNKMLLGIIGMTSSQILSILVSCFVLNSNIFLAIGSIVSGLGITSFINKKFYIKNKINHCNGVISSYCNANVGKIEISKEEESINLLMKFKYRLDRMVVYSLPLLGAITGLLLFLSSYYAVISWLLFWGISNLYVSLFEIVDFGITAVNGVIENTTSPQKNNVQLSANDGNINANILECDKSWKRSIVPGGSLFFARGDIDGILPDSTEVDSVLDATTFYLGPRLTRRRRKP